MPAAVPNDYEMLQHHAASGSQQGTTQASASQATKHDGYFDNIDNEKLEEELSPEEYKSPLSASAVFKQYC